MCEDLRLPITVFSDQIARSIREQIDDYNLNASSMMKDDTEESNEQKLETLDLLAHPEQADKEEIEVNHDKQGVELRTLIKLDITVGNWELVDQFEWDIGYPRNSPEEFAHKLATDLGLSGEFKTAIAHSIREQIHVYIKSLLLVGYEFNNTSIIDDEIRNSFLPHLRNIIRESSSIERFTPSMIELSDAAVAKAEKDRMREARRKRRGTRARRGIILPDREPQKTHRTGFAVAPESELTDEQFLQNQLNDPQSNKRSAALKARMNIAAEAANVGDDLIEEAPTQHHHHHQQQQQMQGSISFANTIKMNDFQRQVMKQNQMNAWQQQQFHSATVCGPDDPVLLYVHCSVNKPDPHVRILRKTTPSRIPPVIIVTGVKKESRLPKICDERPDTSVKIIVLDLRTNSDPNKANENVPASKFKKMPKEIWDNVLQIGRAFKPNQPTDCPIQTSPPTTIDVYANILPKNPSSQQFMRQQQQQQQQHMPLAHQINPYNNAGMFHPGMMYGNLMPSNGANPMMFNQPNYMNVMAAAHN
ncbi:hypothetical protein G6F42_018326 [Rhizopus arrhizus]|nr:hypothetical protein G6F42_018326 [Rhizopus arrhizus]